AAGLVAPHRRPPVRRAARPRRTAARPCAGGNDHRRRADAAGSLSRRPGGDRIRHRCRRGVWLAPAVAGLAGYDAASRPQRRSLLLVSLRRIGDHPFAALLGLAGLLHGHALAETIIGAEPTPLVAYLGGLAVTEYAIAAAAVFGWRLLSRAWQDTMPRLDRIAGAAVTAVGAVTLVLNLAG